MRWEWFLALCHLQGNITHSELYILKMRSHVSDHDTRSGFVYVMYINRCMYKWILFLSFNLSDWLNLPWCR